MLYWRLKIAISFLKPQNDKVNLLNSHLLSTVRKVKQFKAILPPVGPLVKEKTNLLDLTLLLTGNIALKTAEIKYHAFISTKSAALLLKLLFQF